MQTSSIPDRRRTRELETGVKLPPSLVTEIIPRMFRVLPQRHLAAGLRPDRPRCHNRRVHQEARNIWGYAANPRPV